MKNRGKSKNSVDSPRFTAEEKARIQLLRELIAPLKEKHNLSDTDITQLLGEEITVPTSVFTKQLTVLQSITKYLKENKSLSFRKISSLIGRDERNIGRIYSDAAKKHADIFLETQETIPVSILNSNLSAAEAVVFYLKESRNHPLRKIAELLHRSEKTIWTLYNRAKTKHAK